MDVSILCELDNLMNYNNNNNNNNYYDLLKTKAFPHSEAELNSEAENRRLLFGVLFYILCKAKLTPL